MNAAQSPLPTAATSVFIACDVQQNLAAAMPAKFVQGHLTRAGKLLEAANGCGVPAAVVEQDMPSLGAALPVVAGPAANAPVFRRATFSALRDDTIVQWLEDQKRHWLVLAGMESHISVLQTALDWQSRGGSAAVIEDAVLARHKDDHRAAIAQLRASGVAILSFEALLFAWIGAINNPAFKLLSHLTRERDH
ncbi:MAG: isochorismatase family protein [Candidatus Dadabacteria bacterium]|nr:MAG: isochorismatase family protein [Candidatus Dadabacteria bacterium]